MKKVILLWLIIFVIKGEGGIIGTITNGGDRGILLADCPDNPEKAADSRGDVICWAQPNTQTFTSNIVITRIYGGDIAKLMVLPNVVYVKKGGTFSVNILLSNVKGIDVAGVNLLFDPTKLNLIGSPTEGNIFKENSVFLFKIGTGTILINAGRLNDSFTGTGSVAENIIFQALVSDPTSQIVLEDTILLGQGEIPHSTYTSQIFPISLNDFAISYPNDVIAGRPFTVTLTAKDQRDIPIKDYKGSVTILSKLGTITFKINNFVDGVAIATITRYEVGTMVLRVSDNNANVFKETGSITVRYLGDFGSDYNENPDKKINVRDLWLFIQYWRTNNPKGDIGSNLQEGNPPYILSKSDGRVNTWDLGIFVKMWRWSNKNKALSVKTPITPKVFLTPSLINTVKGNRFTVEVKLEDGVSLIGCSLKITFDPSKIKLISVTEGGYFKEGFPFKTEIEDSAIIIDDAIWNIEEGISQGGIIALLEFEALTEDPTSRIEIVSSCLLGIEGFSIHTKEGASIEPLSPSYSALFQSVPNPAKNGVWIPYQLKEGADVQIKIYNILGQVVKQIDLGYKPSSYYKSLEPGKAAYWDLTNDNGQRIATGLYFYQIKAGKFNAVKSMVVTK